MVWHIAGYQGQHDEDGIVLEDERGLLMRTPSIHEVARVIGKSHHDPETWEEYRQIAQRIVKASQ